MKISHVVLFLPCFILLYQDSKGYGNVRLINGSTPQEGVVQVQHNNTWTTLLYASWIVIHVETVTAFVICRSLGYTKGKDDSHPLVGSYARYPYRLKCHGSENDINECPKYSLNYVPSNPKAAYVTCSNLTKDEKNVQVRLVETNHSNYGIVELLYQGNWSRFCFSSGRPWWGREEAKVICRMLGYKEAVGPVFFKVSANSNAHNLIERRRYNCGGNEKTIMGCANWDFNHRCSSKSSYTDRYAGVLCQETEPPPPFQVRLTHGVAPNTGLVEVRYHGVWGTICPDDISEQHLEDYVCHRVGFLGYEDAGWRLVTSYTPRKEISWDFEVSCNGSKHCNHSHVGRVKYDACYFAKEVTCKVASGPIFSVSGGCMPVLTINRAALNEEEKKLITFYEVNITNNVYKRTLFSSFYVPAALSKFALGEGAVYQHGQNRPLEAGTNYWAIVRAVYQDKNGKLAFGHWSTRFVKTTACPKSKVPKMWTTLALTTPTLASKTTVEVPVAARHKESLGSGAIVGLVVGVLAIVVIVAVAVYIMRKRSVNTANKGTRSEQLGLNQVNDPIA